MHTLVVNKIVDHSDIVGASPNYIFSFDLDLARTTARRDEKDSSLGFGATYITGMHWLSQEVSIFRFDLMIHCWHADRDERPTFAHIVSELDDILHGTISTEKSDIHDGIYVYDVKQTPEIYLSPVSNPGASEGYASLAPRSLSETSGHGHDTSSTPVYLTIEAWSTKWNEMKIRWPVNSLHKGQWRGVFMFSLICALKTTGQKIETPAIRDAIAIITLMWSKSQGMSWMWLPMGIGSGFHEATAMGLLPDTQN